MSMLCVSVRDTEYGPCVLVRYVYCCTVLILPSNRLPRVQCTLGVDASWVGGARPGATPREPRAAAPVVLIG